MLVPCFIIKIIKHCGDICDYDFSEYIEDIVKLVVFITQIGKQPLRKGAVVVIKK